MGCKISSGYTTPCEKPFGGLKTTVWIGNLSEVALFTEETDKSISAIDFKVGGRLWKFESTKESFDSVDDIVKTAGQQPNYPQTLNLRLFEKTQADKNAIDELANADAVFVIIERGYQTFELFGKDFGLDLTAAPRNSGQNNTADVRRAVTLSGNEGRIAPVFQDTDYATTVALLETYLTPAV